MTDFLDFGDKFSHLSKPKINEDNRVHSYEEGKAFYESREWRTLRNAFVKKMEAENKLFCVYCKLDLFAHRAFLNVDHKKPLRFFWNLRLDESNLQITCTSCNTDKGNNDRPYWYETPMEVMRKKIELAYPGTKKKEKWKPKTWEAYNWQQARIRSAAKPKVSKFSKENIKNVSTMDLLTAKNGLKPKSLSDEAWKHRLAMINNELVQRRKDRDDSKH